MDDGAPVDKGLHRLQGMVQLEPPYMCIESIFLAILNALCDTFDSLA